MADLLHSMADTLRERMLFYRGPDAVMALFFLGSAFFVLLVTGIEHHLRGR